jgi:putative ABC transport system permease protein
MWGWTADLRAALHALRASRWTTLAAIVTLALGTGANTAVLAVAYGVLLRPLPFPEASRLLRITTERPVDGSDLGLQMPEFDDWKTRLTTVDAVAAYARAEFTVRGAGEPEVVQAAAVTGDFFRVLGVPPAAGQAFADDHGTSVVALSDRYARRLAASGPTVGRSLSLGALAMTVGAVMPPAFGFPDDDVQVWVPARSVPTLNFFDPTRDFRQFRLIARLRPGVTIEDARQDAERVLREIHPGVSGRRVAVRRIDDDLVGAARPVIGAFAAAGLLVLLVACANVATLLAGRALTRQREFAVRLAIGADPSRLVRAALAESLVIAAFATGLGVIVARLTLNALLPLVRTTLPRAADIGLGVPVLVVSVIVGLFVAVACGVAPALAAAQSDVAIALRREAGTTTGGGHRVRAPLVVAQIALTVLLLTGAGLFARTVWGLWTTDIGAERDHVLTARLALTETTRFDATSRGQLVDDLLRRVRGLPGVEAAGLGSDLPPRVNQLEMTIRFMDDSGRDDTHGMNLVTVTPGYFRALGVRMIRGRDFDDVDAAGEAPVAVMSEMLEREFAAKRDLLGTRLTIQVPAVGGKRVRPTLVGVVSDVRFVGLEKPTEANIYIPWRQLPTGVSYLVIRTQHDPAALEPAVLATIHELDPTLPPPVVRPLGEEVSLAMAGRTLRLQLVAALALVALAVSIVGLTSALARSVAERQREIAVRLAIGATPSDAAGLVVGHGARLLAVGLGVGVALAIALGRVTSSLLFGVSAYDPLTYALVATGVLALGLAACYFPARRAASVDPIELLRIQ